jgi:hypothetical protein
MTNNMTQKHKIVILLLMLSIGIAWGISSNYFIGNFTTTYIGGCKGFIPNNSFQFCDSRITGYSITGKILAFPAWIISQVFQNTDFEKIIYTILSGLTGCIVAFIFWLILIYPQHNNLSSASKDNNNAQSNPPSH